MTPFAEWSTDDGAIDSSARRSLPELGLVVQEIGRKATSPAPASAMVLWINSQIERATADAALDEGQAMRFLACGADGHGYTFTMPGRFDLLAIGPASRLDSPYSICVGGAGTAPACHAVADGTRWQVDVADGDELTVQSSRPESRLDARLCPSNERSPFAEWSQTAEAVRTIDKRPPPYVGIVVQSAR